MDQSLLPTIAVFDSGIGGLSILSGLASRFPGARYLYGCDSEGFPYGIKTDEEVVRRVLDFNLKMIRRFPQVDLLVVACNTASTVALELLRQNLSLPIVGVVPALKPAAQMTRTATIGLLATPATIKRPYTLNLVAQFARGRRVFMHGSSTLVTLAEAKLRGRWDARMGEEVARELAPLFAQSPLESFKKLDTVVLGCTHFPHLIEELRAVAPWDVQWVDSTQAIAARVGVLLGEKGYDLELLRTEFSAPLQWFESPVEGHPTRPPPQAAQEIFGSVDCVWQEAPVK